MDNMPAKNASNENGTREQVPGISGAEHTNTMDRGIVNTGADSNNNDKEDSDIENANIKLNLSELMNLASWASFNAIIEIVLGAFCCLGIITAIFGIPIIMSGAKLFRASKKIKKFIAEKNTAAIEETLTELDNYFRLKGVTIIIVFIFALIMIFLYGTVVYLFLSNLDPQFFNSIGSFFK